MKNKIYLLVLVLAIVGPQTVSARELTRDELEAISTQEKSWHDEQVSSEGFIGTFPTVVTNTGSRRLEDVPASFGAKAELFRAKPKSRYVETFRDFCGLRKYVFEGVKKEGRKYTLKVRLNPFATADLENPVRILDVATAFTANAQSNTSDIGTAPKFRAMVDQQLANQLNREVQDGSVELDLTGWDEVACDLQSGNAQLAFNIRVRFEAAKVSRFPVVGEQTFTNIYDSVQSLWKPQASLFKNYVIGGATLAITAQNILKKNVFEIGVDRFFSLYSQLFSLTTGQPRTLSTREQAEAIRSMDVLSRGPNMLKTEIQQSIAIVEE